MTRSRRAVGWALTVCAGLLLSACAAPEDDVTDPSATTTDTSDGPVATVIATEDRVPAVASDALVATVADAPDGDTRLGGPPLVVRFDDVPRWLVGLPAEDGGSVLVVVTESDEVHAIEIGGDGQLTRVRPPRETVDWHRPPVLVADAGSLAIAVPPDDAARDAPVLPLPGGGMAYVSADGELVVVGRDAEETRSALDLLRDAWLVPAGEGRVAALAAPTDAYGHGVLGDAVEAEEVVVVDLVAGTVLTRIRVDGVVEGLRPVVGEVAGLDEPVVVVTVSDDEGGADVVVYGSDGDILASTGAIGTGNRWRHVIALDPAVGLVEVVTPHLGKELRVATVDGDRLVPRVSAPGAMSSHAIGSRDLDEAKLLTADGARVVVGPGPDRSELVALSVDDGAAVARHALPSRWASNLAAVRHGDGTLVAVGTEDGSVLVWPPTG